MLSTDCACYAKSCCKDTHIVYIMAYLNLGNDNQFFGKLLFRSKAATDCHHYAGYEGYWGDAFAKEIDGDEGPDEGGATA